MKRVFEWHGHRYHYIGTGPNGENMRLQESTFDCGWYWSIGYIETFTNKRAPWNSIDIESHTHFEYLMTRNRYQNWFDAFNEQFKNPFLTESEVWKICELMKSLYTARHYADMIWRGGAHYTQNPCEEIIKNETEYKRINDVVIPAMLKELYKILDGEKTEGEEDA